MKNYFLFGAICALFLCLSVSAQTPTATPTTANTNTTATTPATNDEANEANSDIVITATVQAKELKMEIVPTPKVEFPGSKPRQTVWEADRQNLPNPVEPGVVYRDIGVRLRIYSRFSEITRIVLEAIDETNTPAETPKQATTTNPVTTQPTVPATQTTAAKP
jgi:hypothetical protein